MHRSAYATVWCGSSASGYFGGLKVLLHSIRKQDPYRPILVLTQGGKGCIPAADGPQLQRLATRHAPLTFERVRFPVHNYACKLDMDQASRPGLKHMFLKFALWNMTRYDRIVVIDSDAMVLRSLAELWALPLAPDSEFHAAAAMTIMAKEGKDEKLCMPNSRPYGIRKFNTGMMVIRPNTDFYERVAMAMQMRRGFMRCIDGDQSPFNVLFRPDTRCLSQSFNCYDPYYIAQPEVLANGSTDRASSSGCVRRGDRSPHVVHFAMTTKPWHPSTAKRGLQRTANFYKLWDRALADTAHH